ncbi:hypothetical protein EHM82_00550 [bacterium]|nr:MAG: hypothetical protein EHM82_00550 [bacterium]
MRRYARTIAVFALFLPVPALVAQEDPLQASRAGERWVLTAAGDSAVLETSEGRSLRLALPDKALVSSLAALDGGWMAAGSYLNGERRALFLLKGDARGARSLPVPAGQEGLLRFGPVLLTEGDGRLAGMAWLEGDGLRTLGVRAAAWNGERWEAPVRVAPPGPGSQLALSGAVLADGSWLLAWSAFDGADDEILWSLRAADGTWSKARRLSADNAVPDITPAVTASGDGALIAWSRFDGQGYSVHLARFAGGGWRGERAAAPTGSVRPAFESSSGRPLLLYRTVVPAAWSVLQLDPAGRALARATVPSSLPDRPVLVTGAGGEVRMRWPAAAREVAVSFEGTP